MEMKFRQQRDSAFTLIELLVVIVIIATLMGLAFPAFQAVMNQARKTQAKNDLTQIVTAVNAFYTEYGKYPVTGTGTSDLTFGPSGAPTTNETLMDPLRGTEATPTLNPRQVVFLSPAYVKDSTNPRSGVVGTAGATFGQFFDPWGTNFAIRIDADYSNDITNPYGANNGAGPATLRQGVIAWSLGKNGALGGGAAASGFTDESGTAGVFSGSSDVISWQ